MTRRAADFQLWGPLSDAHTACRRGAERIQWKVAEVGPDRLLIKKAMTMWAYPTRVEIRLGNPGPATAVHLSAKVPQLGPLAVRELEHYLAELQGAIRLEAESPAATAAGR
jgi:hypothetical protein